MSWENILKGKNTNLIAKENKLILALHDFLKENYDETPHIFETFVRDLNKINYKTRDKFDEELDSAGYNA